MRTVALIGVFLAVVVAVAVLIFYRPPLRLASDAQGIHVDVQTLGEYPTDVARVRLIDRSTGEVVWEVRSDAAQLSTFDLRVGDNPITPSNVAWGSFEVVVPKHTKSFRIERGRSYTLEIWGTSLPITRTRTEFTA